ncbi:hypothetical protein GYH30_003100 [Glycine max]|nr:hypothetical protein GYH30_003100 [Glycine max]
MSFFILVFVCFSLSLSIASITCRVGSTASSIVAISASSDVDSFRFNTMNRSSFATSIFLHRDLSMVEKSGSSRGVARRSSTSAVFDFGLRI